MYPEDELWLLMGTDMFLSFEGWREPDEIARMAQLVCMHRREAGAAGIMLFPDAAGSADKAALAFLSGTVVFDPNNACNACGHGHSCSMDCKSCSLH